MKISDKNILITGSAKRIGRALALDLASQGANIIIHYFKSSKDANALKKKIADQYAVKVMTVKADLASSQTEKMIKTMLGSIEKSIGSVDVLINNASAFYATPLEKIKEKDWDRFHNIHLKSSFFLSKEIGLKMKKKRSGKIINIVDTSMNNPNPDFLPYIISKAGLQQATVGLAKALAPYVQVNAVAPGPILPPVGATSKHKKKVIEGTLLKRFGDPSDIVATINYLLTGTDFVTGVMIPVDGGSRISSF
jgi:NAD(P)-dependent dehydrogenase (short-subunit alcohol dehydrogenase family)